MRICVLLEKSGETVLLRPDEIASGDTIAETVNTKKTLKVALSPQMEAWGFAEHTRTYVTAIDLDRTTNRVIFRGRVSSVQKNMDASGRYTEDLICGSAVEYLDDSAQAYTYDSGYAISAVVGWIIQHHNSSVNAARQLKVGNISPAWSTCKNIAIGSHFEALRALVASDDLTQQNTNKRVRRWFHERYEADGTYIDILDYDSIRNGTALLIGDNIKNLKYERGLESKIVTHFTVVSGLSVEGYTYQYTAVDSAAYQLYGRHEVVIHDTSIYSNEPHYVQVYNGTAWVAVVSDSYDAMMAALATRAETELEKYKTPYTKITLDAEDLAALGVSGYASFAVGQRLPVICPALGIVEDEMLITSIRRNLANGQIVSLTLERGEPPSGTISGSLALRMAQLKEANDRAQQKRDEEEADKLNAKFEQELDGYGMKEFTTESYDALPDDSPYKMGTSKTLCMVKDEGTGKTAMYVAGQHIDEGGGGGGGSFDVGVPVYPTSDKRAWYVLAKGSQHHTRIYSNQSGITKSRINAEGVETLSYTARYVTGIFTVENVLNNNKYDIRYSSPHSQPVTKTIESDTPIKMMLVTNQFYLRGDSPDDFDWLELYTGVTSVVAVVNNVKVTLFSSNSFDDDYLHGEALGEVALGEIE